MNQKSKSQVCTRSISQQRGRQPKQTGSKSANLSSSDELQRVSHSRRNLFSVRSGKWLVYSRCSYVRLSTTAAKRQHPNRSHERRLPWAAASLQPPKPNPSGASTLGSRSPHTHALAAVQLPANHVLRFQSERGISLQSNCDLMGTCRGFSEEEVTNDT